MAKLFPKVAAPMYSPNSVQEIFLLQHSNKYYCIFSLFHFNHLEACIISVILICIIINRVENVYILLAT